MITPIARRQLLQCSRNARSFSSSPVVAAATVKKLAVIGAGQMVRSMQNEIGIQVTDRDRDLG